PRLDHGRDPRGASRAARGDRRGGRVPRLARLRHGRGPQPARRWRPHGHLSAGPEGRLASMATQQEQLPRSGRKGPLITGTCKCGGRKELRYGEQWKCEKCGRRYDTRKIPVEEYAAIRRTQVRYRLVPLISGLILLAAMIVFFIEGRAFAAVVAV